MSTIAQNLEALQQAKADIAEAITDMGGTVQEGDGFSSFAADILTIPAGGGDLEAKTVALDMASGNQEISPSSGYDGLSKVTVTRPATFVHENIKDGVSIGGVTGTFAGTPIANDLDGLVDGSITAFIMPAGKSTIKASLFDGNRNLLTADLTGATNIGNYAFMNCSNAAITLPSGLTSVGQQAFYNAGKSSAPMQLLATGANCTVAASAFYNAKISKVQGTFGTIGGAAFQNSTITDIDLQCGSVQSNAFYGLAYLVNVDIVCTALLDYAFQSSRMGKLHVVINGQISSYALANLYYVNDLSITGTITSIGDYAFNQMGYSRVNPSQNVLVLDFSSSTFTSVGQYAFGGTGTSNGLNYFTITLPSTCSSLSTRAFCYIRNSDLYYLRETPPTIQSNTFTNASNIRHFVPYGSVTAYRTATNWTTQAAVIYGWAPANTFSQGDTLPTMTADYYGITWYSDKTMTQQVTTVTDPTAPLYCTVGTTVLYYEIGAINAVDCTVTISDGTNTYTTGDIVATGTSLTISTTATDPTKPAVYMFAINGTDYAPASSETITVASDISVTALYWDEVSPPYNSTLNDNTWGIIKDACQQGLASALWQVGDIKTDSNGIDWMLVDLKEGRYARSDGTGYTNAVFMMVPLMSASTKWYTSSYSESYGQSALRSKMQSGGVYFNGIDATLSALADANKITLKANLSTSSATVDVTCSFFSPCYTEMGFTGSYGNATSAETVCNGVTMGSFQYFSDNTASKRIKPYPGGSSGAIYLTRSRSSSTYAVAVTGSGSNRTSDVSYANGACPCVAF